MKIFTLCACVSSCFLGYEVGASAHVGKIVQAQFGLTDVQRGLFIGALNFFTIFGALFSPILIDKYGRRLGFFVSSQVFMLGLFTTATSQSSWWDEPLQGLERGWPVASIPCTLPKCRQPRIEESWSPGRKCS